MSACNMRKAISLFVIIVSYHVQAQQKIDVQELRCLVCKASLDEFSKAVRKIDPSRTVDIGGYRLDSQGNYHQKAVSEAKSEMHLSELMEDVCPKLDDYVRARWKLNGTLTVLRLITESGQMNTAMSEVDVVQDDDLNKSLKYYCEEILAELEENIIRHFQNDATDVHTKICVEESGLCEKVKAGPTNKIKEDL